MTVTFSREIGLTSMAKTLFLSGSQELKHSSSDTT